MDLSTPESTLRGEGPLLCPTRLSCLGPEVTLQRIILGSPHNSRPCLHFGVWRGDNSLVQYQWNDGTSLVDSSMSQLRLLQVKLQVHEAASPHVALRKWMVQLSRPIPGDIWHLTWLSFRSAAENTLLWQFLYRFLATQRWRLPGRSASDPKTTQCSQTIYH